MPAPKENEVRIRIRAATVTAGDCEFRALKLPFILSLPLRMFVGITAPKRITILGQEFAGEIESAGKDVRRFREGDQVFGTTGLRLGAYAEYTCRPAEGGGGALAHRPLNVSFEEAACVPMGGLEALYFLRQAKIRSGERVLINGAGGSIGTIAVQLARYYGAEVTAVDSAPKLDMLRAIGADRVIDFTREQFADAKERYDVIFDVVGKSPFSASMRSLRPGGRYLVGNARMSQRLRGRLASAGSKRVVFGTADHRVEDLLLLKELIEAGKIRPVIDRRYPLEQIAEAHRYVDTGRKAGNVVISIGPYLPSTPGGEDVGQ